MTHDVGMQNSVLKQANHPYHKYLHIMCSTISMLVHLRDALGLVQLQAQDMIQVSTPTLYGTYVVRARE